MITIEQIDQLRKRINVSYEDAKEALEINNGEILDAITYLERNNKTQSEFNEENNQKEESEKKSGKGKGIVAWCKKIIKKGNSNFLSFRKHEKNSLQIPLTVLVILFVLFPKITVLLLVLALVTGYKFKFNGSDIKNNSEKYN
ncbi:MAG: DUF4342 domain-containing protein [Clostridiaceae bacterium]